MMVTIASFCGQRCAPATTAVFPEPVGAWIMASMPSICARMPSSWKERGVHPYFFAMSSLSIPTSPGESSFLALFGESLIVEGLREVCALVEEVGLG